MITIMPMTGPILDSLRAGGKKLTKPRKAILTILERSSRPVTAFEIADRLVGALRVGMALPKAIETATQESKAPLRPYLEDLVARLRLGEDAPGVFRDLSRQIPLESVQLFSLTLSAQWAGGGRVASSLAAVGRTVRDRIEVSRRVRAQAVEANVSVMAMMGISYGLAWIMWRANPASFVVFLTSDLGRYLTAGTMLLQAVGILWVRQLSRIRC
jgi:tight adherence protein B